MSGSQQLMMGNAVRGVVKDILLGDLDPKTLAAIEDFLVNPQKWLAGIPEAKTAEEAARLLATKWIAAGQVAEIAAPEVIPQ